MPTLFNPLCHPILLERPRRINTFSAWREHTPFAMLLIDLLRPRIFVELGTHWGVSYCAFCQGVATLGTPTRCYAIDTWEGEKHSGHYGPEVLADLRAHHDPLYSGFSTLMQSTFAEALQHFEDGSVDLLHIDGLHTYEAVKHDFDSWLPKMSRRGVVLLHDTAEEKEDFGVYKLWNEAREHYPHFAFTHGHGLGLLAVGEEQPPILRSICAASEDEAQAISNHFAYHGSFLTQIALIHNSRIWKARQRIHRLLRLRPPASS